MGMALIPLHTLMSGFEVQLDVPQTAPGSLWSPKGGNLCCILSVIKVPSHHLSTSEAHVEKRFPRLPILNCPRALVAERVILHPFAGA